MARPALKASGSESTTRRGDLPRAAGLWVVGHLAPFWPLLVLGLVGAFARDAIRTIDLGALRKGLRAIDTGWLLIALGLTALNVAVMGLYDVIAFRPTGATWRRRWLFGALAFAWSNFLTLGPVAGPAIRLWLYRPDAARGRAVQSAIVHIAVAGGSALVIWVLASAVAARVPGAASPVVQIACVLVLVWALAGTLARLQRTLHRRWTWAEVPVHWPRLLLVGVLDWGLAAVVFVIVLHAAGVRVGWQSACAFFFGQAVGLISLIPGGFGSADAFWLRGIAGPVGTVAAALIAYRALYYVLPWGLASVVMLRLAAHRGARWLVVSRAVLATLLAAGGLLLLLSAASPALAHRLATLERLVPLPVVELSHLAASLIGVLLFVLARALAKGYRAAHRVAVVAAFAGAAAVVLKGLDVEEATLLTVLGGVVWSQAPLFRQPSRGDWLGWHGLGLMVVGIFVFVAFGMATQGPDPLASRRLATFAHQAEGSRFARAVAMLGLAGVTTTLWLLLRTPARFIRPAEGEIRRALELHGRFGRSTNPLMVASGDKAIDLFDGRGMCLYRTAGPYLVVYSDPSVEPGAEAEFLRSLLAVADELDRRLVFYQISSAWIPPLHDEGYNFFKLGEEAYVDLRAFTLSGGHAKSLRQEVNRVERSGCTFDVVTPGQVSPILGELRKVSDAWLASKGTGEKQFSIGFFDAAYLTTFPCAVVRAPDGALVAFANLLPGPGGIELSVDLMRYSPAAPPSVMDYLFAHVFEWGKAQGYQWFNLGMAPLATVGEARRARPTERLAHLVFQHGEHWYNFRGLRQYKDKFRPRWTPRYLAYPTVWEWPRVITHVSALIAGGWRAILVPRED